MVICCVPFCGADSWKCDGSITFYDFPANPDLAAKWIKQINAAVKTKPMWFPRGKPAICSKHFLHTDFKGDTDALKPRCIPTVFGYKYIGANPESDEKNKLSVTNTTPLIVKVKPPSSVVENTSKLRILDVRSAVDINDGNCSNNAESTQIMVVQEDNLQISTHEIDKNNLKLVSPGTSAKSNPHSSNNKAASYSQAARSDAQQPRNNSPGANGIKPNHISKGNSIKQPTLPKKPVKKKEKVNSDLIEIGPNTFLKINPDIIKVNKKQTPSGNTVLQFLMDQKLAKSCSGDMLPKLIQGVPPPVQQNSRSDEVQSGDKASSKETVTENQNSNAVQHVLGHVVDTHACEETCTNDDDVVMEDSQDKVNNAVSEDNASSNKTDASFIEKAPVLLTTKMPLSHCFVDKPKYILQLKQKSRQIASLKFKVSTLNKKIEELEDRCIVQERQLSYSFIKRLKSIRKNASKGDPRATYILEQIRSYSNNSKMRWSDTTLTQCAIWCRKAPYAYEYFKKADFFKLPCLGSVKRFIKKHPEIKFQKKLNSCGPQDGDGDDDESSDFDFDESDGQNGTNELSEDENNAGPVRCENVLSVPSEVKDSTSKNESNCSKNDNEISKATESITSHPPDPDVQKHINSDNCAEKPASSSKDGIPVTVDGSNLELQEIMLPSGEVVQCYSSTIGNSADIGGQYYIIPNVGEQNTSGDHEYNVIQADSLPVVLQNLETSQLHLQQEQLIFIANSTDQVECSETEVTSA